ncbi:MAG: sugar phosphate isomerase/epimerase [Saprospiraceae bacterium]|nr:sugar phosphate isomerase/epimerase [Saprospiraceae bacterium]
MNRRKFIQHSAMASLAVSASPLFGSASSPLNKKSLKFGMIKEDISLLDKFKLVKELGFDGVELDSPNDLNEKDILMARDKSGIMLPGVINSIHWKSPLSDPDPAVRKICTDSMIDALNKCKLYGGTTVLLVPAVVNKDVSYADAWKRSVEEIKKILPEAHKTGIKIAIENVWNNFLLSPMEAAHYIDQFDSDHIGWYMDVGNIVRYGWPEQWISTLGPRILKVDVKEYSRKKQQEEGIWKGFSVEIGDGDCDWANVNKALKDIGYSGWGSAEVPGGDRARLEEISQRMDAIFAL